MAAAPRTSPPRQLRSHQRVLADKGYPSKANRAYLASRGVKATIPDRADQKQNRANKGSAGGRPTGFDAGIYKGRNVVERSFNRLKNWRGIAMKSDKNARNYKAGLTLAATLIGSRPTYSTPTYSTWSRSVKGRQIPLSMTQTRKRSPTAQWPWVLLVLLVIAVDVVLLGTQTGRCIDYTQESGAESFCETGPITGVPGAWLLIVASLIAIAHFITRFLRAKRLS